MGGLLSKKKPEKQKGKKRKHGGVSAADRAILDLKNARDRLRRYQAKLETESAALTRQARALLAAGKRDRAALVVKFRRFREARIAEVDGELLRLEQMVASIEWESRQATVIASIQAGTAALNRMHETMSVDAVQQLMDETREALETEQQISALLGSAATTNGATDADLEAELAALVAGEPSRQQPAEDLADRLPVAPATTPTVEVASSEATATAEASPPPDRVAVPA